MRRLLMRRSVMHSSIIHSLVKLIVHRVSDSFTSIPAYIADHSRQAVTSNKRYIKVQCLEMT